MHKKVFVDLKEPIKQRSGSELNKLRVLVDYQASGCNYFSGQMTQSGVYVYIIPCGMSNGVVTTVITGNQHNDGYKILIKQINRKSKSQKQIDLVQKQIDLVAEKVLPYAQQIADLYSDGRHEDVFKLVKSINF